MTGDLVVNSRRRGGKLSAYVTTLCPWILLALASLMSSPVAARVEGAEPSQPAGGDKSARVTLNRQDDGYRGIWYQNQPTGDVYKYKYSGGLGTYCDYHRPLAVYSPEANKTFFCYGGTSPDSQTKLWHMVSYFDHAT